MVKKSQGMAARHATPKKSKKRPRQVLHSVQHFAAGSTYHAEDEPARSSAITGTLATRARARSTVQALSSDYRYVVGDLKRIAATAGVLVVVMALLAFVLK